MVLSAKDSALVAGSAVPQGGEMKTVRIKVLRPFYTSRKLRNVGDVIEVSAPFANELVSNNKAEVTDATVGEAPLPKAKEPAGTPAGKK